MAIDDAEVGFGLGACIVLTRAIYAEYAVEVLRKLLDGFPCSCRAERTFNPPTERCTVDDTRTPAVLCSNSHPLTSSQNKFGAISPEQI